MRIGCVVKAAGKSRRFGREDKLLAELGGKPVLAHVLDALPREKFERLAAVTSSPQVADLCRARGVEVLSYPGGPVSETVRLGLSAMEGMDGCLFVPGDQPLLGRESVARLLDVFETDPEQICRLSFDGTPGAPVLFPRRLFPKLCALTGEQGGMAAAAGEPVVLVPADRAEELWDTDTEQALTALRRHFASSEHPC